MTNRKETKIIILNFIKTNLLCSLILSASLITCAAADGQEPQGEAASKRLHLNKQQEFVLYTMPKTGTHLMQPLLEKLTNLQPAWMGSLFSAGYILDEARFTSATYMPGTTLIHWFSEPVDIGNLSQQLTLAAGRKQFLSGHAPYSISMESLLKSRQCTVFFVLRDPRDYVISLLHYVNKIPNDMFIEDWFYKLDTHSQIAYIITGTAWYNATAKVVADFAAWKDSPVCCTLKFEKLLGSRGGQCTDADQTAELRKIAQALHLNWPDSKLLGAFNSIYGTGATFHKGVAGSWKQYFTPELKDLFKLHCNHLLIELGYESGSDW